MNPPPFRRPFFVLRANICLAGETRHAPGIAGYAVVYTQQVYDPSTTAVDEASTPPPPSSRPA